MKLNKIILKRRIFILGIILILILFLTFILKFGNKVNSNLEIAKASTSIVSIKEIGLPVILRISAINTDAKIEHLGLTSLGLMDSPKGSKEVAWYKLGPRPGEIGSAVIDGHFGLKNNVPAVFDDLHKLKKGDKISVEDDSGKIIYFIVTKTKIYDLNTDASNIFISNDGISHLNLITCSGVWDKDLKTHSDRLVVFSDRE